MVEVYLQVDGQEAAARWEKRMEEEEEIVQKASRDKVMGWMKAVEVGGL